MMSTTDDRGGRWMDRLSRGVARLREIAASRRVRMGVLLVALPLFGAALVFAWERADVAVADLELLPVALVVAVMPVSVFASTWQLRAMTRVGGAGATGWWEALRVVTLGTLSGLLPVSSGTVVRGGAVVYWGLSPREAGIVLAYDAAVWAGISLLYSGMAALVAGAPELGAAMIGGGVLLLPVIWALSRWLPGSAGRGTLAVARLIGIVAQVLRLQACFFALGSAANFAEASTLAAASPLASIFFFLPGGLGVRELFISVVGAAVGLNAAAAFLAAALNRLVGLSVLLCWEGGLLLRPGNETREER